MVRPDIRHFAGMRHGREDRSDVPWVKELGVTEGAKTSHEGET